MTSYTAGEELPPPVHADRSLEDFWQQLRDAEISSACISTKNTKNLGFPTILSEEFLLSNSKSLWRKPLTSC